MCNGWYTRESTSFEQHCKCLLPVSSHGSSCEASLSPLPSLFLFQLCLAVCFHLTLWDFCRIKATKSVFILHCLISIQVFPYNCLSEVIIFPRCTFVYFNVCILTRQPSADNLSEFSTLKFFKPFVFLNCVNIWLLREKDCFGILKMFFYFWSGSCSRCFQRLLFFVLPFGGDKSLPINAFYVLKSMFFPHFCLEWVYLHLNHTNAWMQTQTAPRKARAKNSTEINYCISVLLGVNIG